MENLTYHRQEQKLISYIRARIKVKKVVVGVLQSLFLITYSLFFLVVVNSGRKYI